MLRIAGKSVISLKRHLFPGDGKEAVAIALCGRHAGRGADFLLVHEVHPIPYAECPVREPDRVTWLTDTLEPLLLKACKRSLAVVKVHSHPTGYPTFSPQDDKS